MGFFLYSGRLCFSMRMNTPLSNIISPDSVDAGVEADPQLSIYCWKLTNPSLNVCDYLVHYDLRY